jgi:hypothetical protein
MNRLFTPCVLLLLMGTSCQKSTVSPASQRKPLYSSALQAGLNGAATFNIQQDINLAGSGFVQISACDGDVLQITGGVYHIVSHQTINQNGITVDQHSNAQDLKMISTTTGARFDGSSTSKISDHFSFTNGKLTITESASVILTTPGPKNNSEIKFDLHETFDNLGNMTATVDNFRFGCK